MDSNIILTICFISYIVGSFPTAYLIGRVHNINIFDVGSGNMGANNTARALGIKWGVFVWLVDSAKGITAILLAREIVDGHHAVATVLSAVAVVTGHNWSIFATIISGRVRGGKGAATASGTWVLLVPPLIIAGILMIWATIVYLTRYVSLAVLTSVALASLALVGMVLLEVREPIYVAYMLVTLAVFYRHKTNIRALIAGTERRLGERAKLPTN
jgi:glycerol-3-phosphate acyltransferase PlsY